MTGEERERKVKWLNRAFKANMKLKSLKAYKNTKIKDMDVSGVSYDGDGSTNTSYENTTENKYMSHCDDIKKIDAKIQEQEKRVKALESEICDAIYTIGNDELESILICRHLARMKVADSAKEINYGERNAARLYNQALEKLSCFGSECH